MTEPVAMPDLAAAIAAFDQATRDDIAAALWQDALDLAAIPPEAAARLADPRNSPAAHGDRMRRFIAHLREHPVSTRPTTGTCTTGSSTRSGTSRRTRPT